MAAYGRPLKGKTRRVPITVHVLIGMLDIIDEYVNERYQQQKGYSRSDFYNEAAKFYLEHLGRLPEGNDERTKIVPKKIEERNKYDNKDNINNINEQK